MKEIPLTQGKVALVDDADHEWLSRYRWCAVHHKACGKWYAQRREGGKALGMHTAILNTPAGMEGDHKNGDGLDNQRHNLRNATHSQNAANSRPRRGVSKYKGVSFFARDQVFIAQIKKNGKSRYLGSFVDDEDAARAYDAAAREIHGEFAWLNFPEATAA